MSRAPAFIAPDRKVGETLQEWVYRALRQAIMTGQFKPGHSITIRGAAALLDVSLMPVREALRRLVAERALELQANRRVTVPRMTPDKLEELAGARIALETLAAVRALPRVDAALLETLRALDQEVDEALASGDVSTYLQKNQMFHLTLYRAGDSQVLIPLIESLWLQFGPFMRMVLGKIGASYVLDRHAEALHAIENRDALALRLAIEGDIRDGMGSLTQEELLMAARTDS
ncbi:GntR family transcriptional regulator [Pokkaliibacter sp. CJK22405]|uniref:GntR family transcriptional regulator n=1 Tax=Pokkaliibacter sp. CJK22405 TaxID=3384615 RepID=UPI0039851CFD